MHIPQVNFHPHSNNNAGLEIIELDDLYHRAFADHDPSYAHRVEFHCLIYITQGDGSHFIDFNRYLIGKGSCIFVNKHQVQAFDFENRPKGKFILFTDEFIEHVRTNIKMPIFAPTQLITTITPVFTPSQTLKESCENLLFEIDKKQVSDNGSQMVMQLLFSALMLKDPVVIKKILDHISKTEDSIPPAFQLPEAHAQPAWLNT